MRTQYLAACLVGVLLLSCSSDDTKSGGTGGTGAGEADAANDVTDVLGCDADASCPSGNGGSSGSGGSSSDGGKCGPTADDLCGVKCVTISIPTVHCVDTDMPGGSIPITMPAEWMKSGGTATNADGTTAFDVSTCVFTFAHTTCGKTWRFDLKNNTCEADHYGSSSDNPCLFTCPYQCTIVWQ